jgi:hypothetical protein
MVARLVVSTERFFDWGAASNNLRHEVLCAGQPGTWSYLNTILIVCLCAWGSLIDQHFPMVSVHEAVLRSATPRDHAGNFARNKAAESERSHCRLDESRSQSPVQPPVLRSRALSSACVCARVRAQR